MEKPLKMCQACSWQDLIFLLGAYFFSAIRHSEKAILMKASDFRVGNIMSEVNNDPLVLPIRNVQHSRELVKKERGVLCQSIFSTVRIHKKV